MGGKYMDHPLTSLWSRNQSCPFGLLSIGKCTSSFIFFNESCLSSPPTHPKKKNLPHHSNAILHQFFLCYFYLGTLLITGYDDLFFFLFLSFQVIKAFLETSRRNSWAEIVHCRLICLLTNMFYQVPEDPTEGASSPIFLVDQVDLVGGTKFIFFEVC